MLPFRVLDHPERTDLVDHLMMVEGVIRADIKGGSLRGSKAPEGVTLGVSDAVREASCKR